jgi:hypothetical protein
MEGNVMRCPSCEVGDKVSEYLNKSRSIFADFSLRLVEDNANLTMVIKPSDQFSCLSSGLCRNFVDFEIVAKSQLVLAWRLVKKLK